MRHRWPKFVALAAAVVLVLGVVSAVYIGAKVASIHRVAVAGLRPAGPNQPQTILLAGSDSRAGETAAQAQQFGSASAVAGQRSDVIILIHLDPGAGKASMLSIPRDTFVSIAGSSSPNRINVAFDQSPSELVATISQNFGITINHFAQENFSGLQGLTDAVGGVCLNFPYPARDGSPTGTGNESGLNIPKAGKQTIHGAMALALVRSRYYQYFVNGRWTAEGTGDIGRITRQHSYMRALASKALHASLANPVTANRVLGQAVHDVTVDKSFTTVGLMRFGLALRGLRPAGMPSWTLPYRSVSNYQGFGDVLMPDPAQDGAVIAAWQSYGSTPATSAPATTPPSPVEIHVINGSGVAGQAAGAAAGLTAAGFTVTGTPQTAPNHRRTTLVSYASGDKAQAQAIAAVINGATTLAPLSSLPKGMVTVTTGTAFAGIKKPAPASSATAPASTSTPPWDPSPC